MINMKGFIALTSVIIIMVVSLVLGMSLSSLSINEMIMGLNQSFSLKAYYLARLCAEEGLIRLKDNNYQGEDILKLEDGQSCKLIVKGNYVMGEADFEGHIKKIQVVVSKVNPKMIIESFKEVASF